MASPQKENGYTGIANELFERMMLFDFPSASPLKIWLFVLRKTYGFIKKTDTISLSQFARSTGLSRQTVNDSLKWLVKRCLLVKGQSTQKGTVYGVNKDYEQWVVKRGRLVKSRPLQVVKRGRHTKETIYKRNICEQSSPSIKLMEEIYPLEELTYVELDAPPGKSKYGSKTMAILVRKFAECAGIKIEGAFDASEWSKPISAIYKRFGKDATKTMQFFENAAAYYKSKNLEFTPHTLEKNFTMLTGKWLLKQTNDLRYE